MALDPGTLAATAAAYASRHPRDILALALKEYSPDLAISFSGAEDVVLVDMAAKIGAHVPGLLARYRAAAPGDVPVHREGARPLRHPDRDVLPAAGSRRRRSCARRDCSRFYQDGHKECCGIRKVEPLTRALDAVARVGHRPAQGSEPGTRTDVPVIQLDRDVRRRRSARS